MDIIGLRAPARTSRRFKRRGTDGVEIKPQDADSQFLAANLTSSSCAASTSGRRSRSRDVHEPKPVGLGPVTQIRPSHRTGYVFKRTRATGSPAPRRSRASAYQETAFERSALLAIKSGRSTDAQHSLRTSSPCTRPRIRRTTNRVLLDGPRTDLATFDDRPTRQPRPRAAIRMRSRSDVSKSASTAIAPRRRARPQRDLPQWVTDTKIKAQAQGARGLQPGWVRRADDDNASSYQRQQLIDTKGIVLRHPRDLGMVGLGASLRIITKNCRRSGSTANTSSSQTTTPGRPAAFARRTTTLALQKRLAGLAVRRLLREPLAERVIESGEDGRRPATWSTRRKQARPVISTSEDRAQPDRSARPRDEARGAWLRTMPVVPRSSARVVLHNRPSTSGSRRREATPARSSRRSPDKRRLFTRIVRRQGRGPDHPQVEHVRRDEEQSCAAGHTRVRLPHALADRAENLLRVRLWVGSPSTSMPAAADARRSRRRVLKRLSSSQLASHPGRARPP